MATSTNSSTRLIRGLGQQKQQLWCL